MKTVMAFWFSVCLKVCFIITMVTELLHVHNVFVVVSSSDPNYSMNCQFICEPVLAMSSCVIANSPT